MKYSKDQPLDVGALDARSFGLRVQSEIAAANVICQEQHQQYFNYALSSPFFRPKNAEQVGSSDDPILSLIENLRLV